MSQALCVRCERPEGEKSKQVSALAELTIRRGERHKSPGYWKAVPALEGKVHGTRGSTVRDILPEFGVPRGLLPWRVTSTPRAEEELKPSQAERGRRNIPSYGNCMCKGPGARLRELLSAGVSKWWPRATACFCKSIFVGPPPWPCLHTVFGLMLQCTTYFYLAKLKIATIWTFTQKNLLSHGLDQRGQVAKVGSILPGNFLQYDPALGQDSVISRWIRGQLYSSAWFTSQIHNNSPHGTMKCAFVACFYISASWKLFLKKYFIY